MLKTNLQETRTLASIIKHEGIKAKGYGTIPKFIMQDRDLSLESKTIYGYLCALCGNGVETFPLRDTILHHLQLSKNGYYDHYNALIEHGYIKVSKLDPSDIKSRNVYTIVANPPKVDERIKLNGIRSDKKLVGQGIDAYGYGILPKAVMIDVRLDAKAKGIYAYLASYAGAGQVAFPAKKHILHHLIISDKTYRRYYNQLIQYNYIIPIQRKEEGRFSVCDYILNQMPDETIGATIQQSRSNRIQSPSGKKQDISEMLNKSAKTLKNDFSPSGTKEDSTKEDGTKEDGRKGDGSIINVSINKFSTNRIINQSEKTAPPPIDLIDNNIKIKLFSKNDIADKIALQELLNESPDKKEMINFINDILCETLTVKPKSPYVWVNKQNTPFQEVFNAFSQINKKHVEYVIFSCYNNDNLINAKNPKAYIKQSLLRSTLTLENFDSRKFKKLETRTPEQIEWSERIEAKIRRDKNKMIEQQREDEREEHLHDNYLDDIF